MFNEQIVKMLVSKLGHLTLATNKGKFLADKSYGFDTIFLGARFVNRFRFGEFFHKDDYRKKANEYYRDLFCLRDATQVPNYLTETLALLVFAGILVMLLDELLSKGYGLGSGISLFIATNISENIIWKSFSPFTVTSDRGVEYEGAVIATIHFLITKKNKVEAIHRAFYRANIPNLSNLVATIIVFIVVIYFQGFRKEIKIANKRIKGFYVTHPIKLFYCSNTPIILESALVSNLYFISQLLYKRYKNFFLIKLLGQWQDVEGGQSIPIGGLAYYISPPRDLMDFIRDPLHSIFYVVFILVSCGLFAKTWVELSGKSSRDVARSLRDNGYYLEGIRETEENIYEQLNRTIPCAATLGGMAIGALTIFADFMGAIGSGTGILLAVTIIYEYFEDFKKDESNKRVMNTQ
jgi:protein transport protein SEC61 subunit alpha